MLTDAELQALFVDKESDRAERKRNANDATKIRQAICAMANDLPDHRRPGVIFVGQENDGSCTNLTIDERLLETLGGWRGDGQFQPFPLMTVTAKTIQGCSVAVIEVQPSDNPPVKFEGRVWIRVGPRRAVASPEEERRLVEKRRWRDLPFDAQGVGDAKLSDLDLRRFATEFLPAVVPADVLAQNNRTQEQQLSALRLLRPEGMPTVAAVLALGLNPQAWFPGAYVQFLRLDGLSLTDQILDSHEVSGTLSDQIQRLDELIAINIRRPVKVGGPIRTEYPDYPIEALRQLVRNALVHRVYDGTNAPVRITWYSDRIEIQSPGGPYGQVTQDNFGKIGVADYRNPTIAGLMLSLGFMERFGVGIAIARKALRDNGNAELEFEVNAQHVLAIVKARQ